MKFFQRDGSMYFLQFKYRCRIQFNFNSYSFRFENKLYKQMTSQQGGLLNTIQSFNFNQQAVGNYRSQSIDPNGFTKWQKNNMYQSSYGKFHSKDSSIPKNKAIPGYGGYVPYVKPEGIYGKGYTPITKQCYSNDKLAKNILGLSTNGFNVTKDALLDKSKVGSSSKYGKTAILKAQPAWSEAPWSSTTHDFFKNPKALDDPNYRQTSKFSETHKQASRSSGFATNHAYLDGQGWNPDKILKGDNHRSEYRDRFNKEKEFHRNTFVGKERKLTKKQWNYKYN